MGPRGTIRGEGEIRVYRVAFPRPSSALSGGYPVPIARRRPLLALSAVLAVLLAGAALAEDLDVNALLDSAKASVGAKHYGKALGDLNLALGEVARLRMEAVKAAVPGAPEGWKAQEIEGQTGMGMLGMGVTATTLKRQYSKGDDTSVELELLADSPLVASFQMLFQFTPPGSQVVMVKGRKAVLELNKEQKSGTLTVLLNAPNSVVKLTGRDVTKADLVDTFGGAFDYDAIEKAISN